jgi:hypothetical protein
MPPRVNEQTDDIPGAEYSKKKKRHTDPDEISPIANVLRSDS